MPTLLASMLGYIRRHALLRPGDRVGVAVSGGADSVALLRLLLETRSELGILLAVIHFNHRIRAAEADADQAFVADLAERNGLEFFCGSGDTVAHARASRQSLEAAARELRYGYFRRLLAEGPLNRIATAHTLDDQAETVLLRFLRGAGTLGLAGIYPKRILDEAETAETRRGRADAEAGDASEFFSGGSFRVSPAADLSSGDLTIVRPLLATRRSEIRAYLASIGQNWQEDASNLDLKHTRNRVRHSLIPLLERDYNPAVQQVLGEMAEVAREEERFWNEETGRAMRQVLADSPSGETVAFEVSLFRQQPLALQRRLIRAAARSLGSQLDFHHVEQVLSVLENGGGETRYLELPGDIAAISNGRTVRLQRRPKCTAPVAYEYELPVPGVVEIPDLGVAIRALLVDSEAYNHHHSLDPELLGPGLRVRNWRAGDRYRPAHTKSARKLKELLQERRIPKPHKNLWPVVVAGEQIVWVPGWDLPEHLRVRGKGPGVVLRQEPLTGEELL